jgi:DNA-binding response OmpR family regulator
VRRARYPPRVRILVVEDQREVRTFVLDTLRAAGFTVEGVGTCAAAERLLSDGGIAGVVLDWMLPDRPGVDLCRDLRRRKDPTPVLMLTARGDVEDRVSGLEAGADDYLKKPFAAAERRARVRALVRRGPRLLEDVVRLGPVEILPASRQVTSGGKEVPLTSREFDILETLLRQRGRVLQRRNLLLAIWGSDDEAVAGSLEVLIARLRRKLADAGAPDVIRTLRGVGYALRDAP